MERRSCKRASEASGTSGKGLNNKGLGFRVQGFWVWGCLGIMENQVEHEWGYIGDVGTSTSILVLDAMYTLGLGYLN